jgi:G protein-coupled glucose receptor regulating Gpa2.
MTRVNLLEETDDLIPLPQSHRRGLIAVAILACLSFASSTVVLLYLTFKLARWHIRTWKQSRKRQEDTVDLSLGLAQHHFTGETKFDAIGGGRVGGNISQKKPHPNQFLVLLYNLLLADIHQASAFLLNAVWVQHNGIRVRTTTCWAQGWFVSTGDLSSSLFITAIAVHTYLAVVWKWTPPQWALYATVIFLWALNYFLALLGVAITRNGHDAGGFYVRAAAWVCKFSNILHIEPLD